jgi:hypothetical protein
VALSNFQALMLLVTVALVMVLVLACGRGDEAEGQARQSSGESTGYKLILKHDNEIFAGRQIASTSPW